MHGARGGAFRALAGQHLPGGLADIDGGHREPDVHRHGLPVPVPIDRKWRPDGRNVVLDDEALKDFERFANLGRYFGGVHRDARRDIDHRMGDGMGTSDRHGSPPWIDVRRYCAIGRQGP